MDRKPYRKISSVLGAGCFFVDFSGYLGFSRGNHLYDDKLYTHIIFRIYREPNTNSKTVFGHGDSCYYRVRRFDRCAVAASFWNSQHGRIAVVGSISFPSSLVYMYERFPITFMGNNLNVFSFGSVGSVLVCYLASLVNLKTKPRMIGLSWRVSF